MSATRSMKSRRIEVRTTDRQESLVRQAAAASNQTLTDFMLSSAVERAERILAERRWFTGSPEQFEELQRMLDEPLPETDAFERLWSRPSPFGRPFTPRAP